MSENIKKTVFEFIAGSPSKTDDHWLGYHTMEEAEIHVKNMNIALKTFETSTSWNREYWPTKPLPWVAKKNPLFGK